MMCLENYSGRLCTYDLQSLPKSKKGKIKFEDGKVGKFVKTSSTGMRRVISNPYCKYCGIRGEYWAVDILQQKNHELVYRINLYTKIENREVRFLADFIKPKSNGGKTKKTNTITLCENCYRTRHFDSPTLIYLDSKIIGG